MLSFAGHCLTYPTVQESRCSENSRIWTLFDDRLRVGTRMAAFVVTIRESGQSANGPILAFCDWKRAGGRLNRMLSVPSVRYVEDSPSEPPSIWWLAVRRQALRDEGLVSAATDRPGGYADLH